MPWACQSAGALAIANWSRATSLLRTSLDAKVSRSNWWPSLRPKVEMAVDESYKATARLNSQQCLLPGAGWRGRVFRTQLLRSMRGAFTPFLRYLPWLGSEEMFNASLPWSKQ